MGRDAAPALATATRFALRALGARLALRTEKDRRTMFGELVEEGVSADDELFDGGERRVSEQARCASVFVLAPEGPDAVPSRGWRGYVVAVWPPDVAVGVAVAAAVDECGAALELHTVVNAPEGRWIVLRATTRYRQTG